MSREWRDQQRDLIRDRDDLERQIEREEWRRRLLRAGDFDLSKLSEQGRHIFGWLLEWDEWTTGGLGEIFGAIRTAVQEAPLASDDERWGLER